MRWFNLFFALISLGLAAGCGSRSSEPKLVLLVTVDQLRGDMPTRYEHRFGKGGFRYLMEQGTYFTQAHYKHSATLTAVGHATIATGGHPAQHGFPGNDWLDRSTLEKVNCMADPAFPIVGATPDDRRFPPGNSPRFLQSSTFGDELVVASGGKSRVFSVSIKDRGAMIPAGFKGTAYWYLKPFGEFVSSTYYMDDYPEWVKQFNGSVPTKKYLNQTWDLLYPRETYVHKDDDDRPYEKDIGGLGRVFPHPLGGDLDHRFFNKIATTPFGDDLTLDFALKLMNEEKVGQGAHTDVMAISLSVTDYIGHNFGPESLEAEDNLYRLDRRLARLFREVDRLVGLEHTLVVLTSDHGVCGISEALAEHGFPSERLQPDVFYIHMRDRLREHFAIGANLVKEYTAPSFYLREAVIEELGLDLAEAEQVAAEALLELPGFSKAITRTQILRGEGPRDEIVEKLHHSFHAQRSGNILVAQDAFWHLHNMPNHHAAMHGSPYSYDTYVPIFVVAPGADGGQRVDRLVGPEDIAPTIANYLGVSPPSGSVGKVLHEALLKKGR